MALLITGGTGFLGSYLARYALEQGGQDRVVVLERYPDRARIADVLDRVTLIEGNVADAAQVSAVMSDHDIDRVAAKAAWLALTKDRPSHRLFNVSSERLPVGQFTRALRALLPVAEINVRPDEPPGHPHTPMDNSRLVDDLGFVPTFDIADGLADYVERVRIADAYNASSSG